MTLPKRINPIIKLTEQCNYNCYFCRYANHRQNDNGTPEHIIKKMLTECIEYNKANGACNMNVIFHGGEPLLYDISRLKSILDYLQDMVDDCFTIEYSVQTNSSLLTDEWIEVFKKKKFDVGISLDGPLGLNGHIATTPENAIETALASYHKLKMAGVHCGFLSVITDKHLTELKKFFDFYLDNDIDSVGLCYCYNKIDGSNVDPEKLGKWLIDLFDLYFKAPKRIRIREFDMVIRRLLNHPHNACSMSCRESCGNYLTVTPNGFIEFCDDYDLDVNRNNALGNINSQSIIDILNGEQYKMMKKRSTEIIENKCRNCQVYEMCRGGCSRNDINDNNYFCETFKILYPYIQKKVSVYLAQKG